MCTRCDVPHLQARSVCTVLHYLPEIMAADGWHLHHPIPMGPPMYHPNPYSTAYQKPKVGLGVVCRCPGNSFVQCLLQRRGPNSASPHKWSFPGGRLEQPGDLEDDGDVGTKRELEEECGGGTPPGLPPLIHIECCKSGKVSQVAVMSDTSIFMFEMSNCSARYLFWNSRSNRS